MRLKNGFMAWMTGPRRSMKLTCRLAENTVWGCSRPMAIQPYVAYGTYREILPPEKLVYTWSWEGQDPMETLVTVEFREVGDSTEVELTHERFPNAEERDKHNEGWVGCLDQLSKLL